MVLYVSVSKQANTRPAPLLIADPFPLFSLPPLKLTHTTLRCFRIMSVRNCDRS
jgi:hypothetical protein